MVPSAACDAVMAAKHPKPSEGGPCGTCAFRPGTEAGRSWWTTDLARLCVEGFREFHCHEKDQVCRGFNAAITLRGVPETEEDKKWCEVAGIAADILSDSIQVGADADRTAKVVGNAEAR